MTREDVAAIVKAEKEARDFQRAEYQKEDAGAIKLLEGQGVSFSRPDTAAIRKIAIEQVYPKVVTSDQQKSLLTETQQIN